MISPSENQEAGDNARAGIPVRLLGEDARAISRLEFHPLGATQDAEKIRPIEPTVSLQEEVAALDGRLRLQTAQTSAMLEAARDEARLEARREWELELEERIAVERSSILKVCVDFSKERAKYFAGVEAEVVKLALAIAARVLHREATLDPLLLSGAVRVALEKVAEDSATVLRVPSGSIGMWSKFFGTGSESLVTIVGDEGLAENECVLDTTVGRVELGVRAQLAEVERGFFDLMQQRPA